MTEKTDPYPPNVSCVRLVLVFARRNLLRAQHLKVKRAIKGVDNLRAIEVMRSALRGRADAELVSPFTWASARAIANASPFTPAKAWYNAPEWVGAHV